TPPIYTLSLHDALPISAYLEASMLPSRTLLTKRPMPHTFWVVTVNGKYATEATLPPTMQGVSGHFESLVPSSFASWLQAAIYHRSEEHTSELQSRSDLV